MKMASLSSLPLAREVGKLMKRPKRNEKKRRRPFVKQPLRWRREREPKSVTGLRQRAKVKATREQGVATSGSITFLQTRED
jgi:hypothetical protein